MVNLRNGKIYKIADVENNMIYIGSTCQGLLSRLGKHRRDYYNRKHKCASVREIFDAYGYHNTRITLIERFPCENRAELQEREKYYIHQYNCVNKNLNK